MDINKKTLQDYAKILRDATPYNDEIVGIKYIEKSDKRLVQDRSILLG